MACDLPEPTAPLVVSQELLERGCELIPLPAAHLIRDGAGFRFEAFNVAYRLAGLGIVADRSPMLAALGEKVDAFLRSDQRRIDLDWQLGSDIDCRYYRVTMARTTRLTLDRCAISFLDLTPQILTERSLRREMTTDSLTGLPNREGFGELIEAAITEGGTHAVMVLDLDRFDRFNACLGSLAGDELLITVARRIKGALRARDSMARIGGDEFGILMAIDDSEQEAHCLAERIRAAFGSPFRLTDYRLSVECSIGIAHGSAEVGDAQELIRHAQFAAKRAKDTGLVEEYQNQALAVARERFTMETALRAAIENRELRLHYQPICDLTSGKIVSFEALARWTDREGREHSPTDFIPVAEESGLIVPLGRWALDEAARTLAGWDHDAGGNCRVRVAVNLSAIQLQRDAITTLLDTAFSRYGVAANRFTLELTESAIVSDPDRMAAIMNELKELGATLAMDDFGTGYSNLAYLQRLPIDVLKIDRSFVTGMLADRDKISIVRAILSLSQALGMRTTAEGIETNELAQTLAGLGCTYGQGYLYAKPLDAASAYALLMPSTADTASSVS
ncbi:putative bifunctional diguanylate cyclase/phosphodiesterase [Sphingomonas oligophenolica]|uniref:EAL domain-containing protein n=1 Tax=Sphingomonas oligophenolica TaxID=301154 RepID=A0A502CNP8_9SPHN|nr:EAL domain-containing protein [Sphingomonas oligophenolica]TPG14498.1 EAL domain-containing protein [Sphingomonas oligophenolica]